MVSSRTSLEPDHQRSFQQTSYYRWRTHGQRWADCKERTSLIPRPIRYVNVSGKFGLGMRLGTYVVSYKTGGQKSMCLCQPSRGHGRISVGLLQDLHVGIARWLRKRTKLSDWAGVRRDWKRRCLRMLCSPMSVQFSWTDMGSCVSDESSKEAKAKAKTSREGSLMCRYFLTWCDTHCNFHWYADITLVLPQHPWERFASISEGGVSWSPLIPTRQYIVHGMPANSLQRRVWIGGKPWQKV